jgi:hypothetical protein
MKLISLIEQPDGSAIARFDFTNKERENLFLEGLTRFTYKYFKKKFIVTAYNKKIHGGIKRRMEMSSELENAIISFCVIELLTEYIKTNKLNKRKKNK